MKSSSFYKSPSPTTGSPRRLTSPIRMSTSRSSKLTKAHSPQPRARSPQTRSPLRACSPTQARVSAFQRITSKAQIRQLVLPGFLRLNSNERKKFTSFDILLKNGTSDSTFNESRVSCRLRTSVLEQSKSEVGDISKIVFDRNLPDDETLISVGRLSLSREDLMCMKVETDVSEEVVDVVLKLIKRKNKRLASKGKVKKKVYCLSSKFCKNLFQSNAQKLVKHNKSLLEFHYLIFPCKFGYWTLVVFDTQKKMVKFFDPLGICNNKTEVLEQIRVFVKHELGTQFETQKARWARIEIEKINETEVYPYFDCGIYILRQAHKFAIQANRPVHPELLPEYRKKLLNYMFKHTS